MTTRSEAMRKVRLLLALAARGGTPHEAAAAASRAQAVLDAWELTREECEAGDSDEMTTTLDARDGWIATEGKGTLWKQHLISGVAQLNGCASFIGRRGKGRSYELSGRRAAIEAVRALCGWLSREIAMISRAKSVGRGLRYAESFRYGMAELIVMRLLDSQRLAFEKARAAAENPAALMRVETAITRIASQQLAERWTRSREGIKVREVTQEFAQTDIVGRIEGRAAGGRMDLTGPAQRLEDAQ